MTGKQLQGGAIYFGQAEHNHARKLMRLIDDNPEIFLRDGQVRVMHINHTHAPKLWRRARPGEIEVRVTHEVRCAQVHNRQYFCDCDPELLVLDKDR